MRALPAGQAKGLGATELRTRRSSGERRTRQFAGEVRLTYLETGRSLHAPALVLQRGWHAASSRTNGGGFLERHGPRCGRPMRRVVAKPPPRPEHPTPTRQDVLRPANARGRAGEWATSRAGAWPSSYVSVRARAAAIYSAH